MARPADSETAAAPSRGRAIAYWATTALLAAEMLIGGTWGILQIRYTRDMMQHLGYPDYFNVLPTNNPPPSHPALTSPIAPWP